MISLCAVKVAPHKYVITTTDMQWPVLAKHQKKLLMAELDEIDKAVLEKSAQPDKETVSEKM